MVVVCFKAVNLVSFMSHCKSMSWYVVLFVFSKLLFWGLDTFVFNFYEALSIFVRYYEFACDLW